MKPRTTAVCNQNQHCQRLIDRVKFDPGHCKIFIVETVPGCHAPNINASIFNIPETQPDFYDTTRYDIYVHPKADL